MLEKHVYNHGNNTLCCYTKKETNREYYYDKDSWSIVVKLSTTAKIKSLLMLPLVIPIVAVVWTLAGLAEVFAWLTSKAEDVFAHLHTIADKSSLFQDCITFLFERSVVSKNNVWSAELKKELEGLYDENNVKH